MSYYFLWISVPSMSNNNVLPQENLFLVESIIPYLVNTFYGIFGIVAINWAS